MRLPGDRHPGGRAERVAVDHEGPLYKQVGEVMVIANFYAQGRIIFQRVARFLGPQLEDHKLWSVVNTVNALQIVNKRHEVSLVVKGSDTCRLHSMAPSPAICDELAQWPPGQIDAMLAAIRTLAGKIDGFKVLIPGTRPGSDSHSFAESLLHCRNPRLRVPDGQPARPLTKRQKVEDPMSVVHTFSCRLYGVRRYRK